MTQLSSDPLDILIRHNTWANRILLERCRDLSSDQFHEDFGIGPGSKRSERAPLEETQS